MDALATLQSENIREKVNESVAFAVRKLKEYGSFTKFDQSGKLIDGEIQFR